MPRACPVVRHAGFYNGPYYFRDATGLPRGPSRWFLQRPLLLPGCRGLAPWSVTLVSTTAPITSGMPRACPVVRHAGFYARFLTCPLLPPLASRPPVTNVLLPL